jgi:acyl carrier protein
MNVEQGIEQIQTMVSEALTAKGLPTQKLTEDTVLLGGGVNIDSLDLAGIVVTLTEDSSNFVRWANSRSFTLNAETRLGYLRCES